MSRIKSVNRSRINRLNLLTTFLQILTSCRVIIEGQVFQSCHSLCLSECEVEFKSSLVIPSRSPKNQSVRVFSPMLLLSVWLRHYGATSSQVQSHPPVSLDASSSQKVQRSLWSIFSNTVAISSTSVRDTSRVTGICGQYSSRYFQ